MNIKKDISYRAEVTKTPTNQEESDKYANILATGNYPVGLDGCFTVGISGGCGKNCFVFQGGGCGEPKEGFENWDINSEELHHLYNNGYYVDEIKEWCQLKNIEIIG